MNDYKVKMFVPGGAGVVEERFKAGSEYNARRLIEARYPQRGTPVVDVTVDRSRSSGSRSGSGRR